MSPIAIAPDAEVSRRIAMAGRRGLVDTLLPFAFDAGTYVNGMTEQDDHGSRGVRQQVRPAGTDQG